MTDDRRACAPSPVHLPDREPLTDVAIVSDDGLFIADDVTDVADVRAGNDAAIGLRSHRRRSGLCGRGEVPGKVVSFEGLRQQDGLR
ncbi:MAG TPA: hypothetical protein VF732_09395 [Nitrospira sp.]